MASKIKINKHILAVVLVVAVVAVLLLSGPASAITVGVHSISDDTPNEGSSMNFLVQVDLHSPDVVNIQDISLNITDGAGDDDICTFFINGTEGSSCDSTITINSCTVGTEVYNDSAVGYGYGYGYGDENGFGYINVTSSGGGYGYVSGYGYGSFNTNLQSTAEISCNVTWTAASVSSNTEYSIYVQSNLGGESYFSNDNDPSTVTVQNVAVNQRAGGSSSSTSDVESTVTDVTTDAGILDEGEVVNKEMIEGDQVSFNMGGESHSVTLIDVNYYSYTKSATFEVASTPQTVKVTEGATEKVDLDGDGVKDLSLYLKSVDGPKSVSVEITALEGGLAGKVVATPGEGDGVATPGEGDGQGGNLTWLWILIIIVLIIIVGYFLVRHRK